MEGRLGPQKYLRLSGTAAEEEETKQRVSQLMQPRAGFCMDPIRNSSCRRLLVQPVSFSDLSKIDGN